MADYWSSIVHSTVHELLDVSSNIILWMEMGAKSQASSIIALIVSILYISNKH